MVGLVRHFATAGLVAFAFPLLYLAFTAPRASTSTTITWCSTRSCAWPRRGLAWSGLLLPVWLTAPRARRLVPLAFALLIAVSLCVQTVRATAHAHASFTTLETRSQSMVELARLAQQGKFTRVGIAQELRVHAYDLRRLGPLPHEVLPSAELFERRGEFDALVVAREYDTDTLRNPTAKQARKR